MVDTENTCHVLGIIILVELDLLDAKLAIIKHLDRERDKESTTVGPWSSCGGATVDTTELLLSVLWNTSHLLLLLLLWHLAHLLLCLATGSSSCAWLRDWVAWLWWWWWKAHLLCEDGVGEDVALLLVEWRWDILPRGIDKDVLVIVHFLVILHLKILVIVKTNHRKLVDRKLETLARLCDELLPCVWDYNLLTPLLWLTPDEYFHLELGRINNRNDGEESEERENE